MFKLEKFNRKQGLNLGDSLIRYKKAILLIVLVFLIFSLFRNIASINSGRKRVEEARARVENLEKEKKLLEKKLSQSQSQEYMEKQLRDKLNLARQGEIVVILPPDEVVKSFSPQIPQEQKETQLANWQKWMKLLM